MSHNVNWKRLLEQRRAKAGEPDEASVARHVASWRRRLANEAEHSDEALDDELVKLLEAIHHAF